MALNSDDLMFVEKNGTGAPAATTANEVATLAQPITIPDGGLSAKAVASQEYLAALTNVWVGLTTEGVSSGVGIAAIRAGTASTPGYFQSFDAAGTVFATLGAQETNGRISYTANGAPAHQFDKDIYVGTSGLIPTSETLDDWGSLIGVTTATTGKAEMAPGGTGIKELGMFRMYDNAGDQKFFFGFGGTDGYGDFTWAFSFGPRLKFNIAPTIDEDPIKAINLPVASTGLPAAASFSGDMRATTDSGLCWSDGTNWRKASDNIIVA